MARAALPVRGGLCVHRGRSVCVGVGLICKEDLSTIVQNWVRRDARQRDGFPRITEPGTDPVASPMAVGDKH